MRNIIFDLGGVVFDWNPDFVLKKFYSDLDSREALKAALFQHVDWLQMDRGLLTESEVAARVGERTGRSVAELADLFDAVRMSLRPKPDTVALIERLAREGVPLYCLSNMPASTFAHLREQHAFWPRFRGIVISGEVKMMKPEREIFQYLLDRFDLAPAETVFIDDHRPNIEAAQAIGLHTVLFRDARQCELELQPLLAGHAMKTSSIGHI